MNFGFRKEKNINFWITCTRMDTAYLKKQKDIRLDCNNK